MSSNVTDADWRLIEWRNDAEKMLIDREKMLVLTFRTASSHVAFVSRLHEEEHASVQL